MGGILIAAAVIAGLLFLASQEKEQGQQGETLPAPIRPYLSIDSSGGLHAEVTASEGGPIWRVTTADGSVAQNQADTISSAETQLFNALELALGPREGITGTFIRRRGRGVTFSIDPNEELGWVWATSMAKSGSHQSRRSALEIILKAIRHKG